MCLFVCREVRPVKILTNLTNDIKKEYKIGDIRKAIKNNDFFKDFTYGK
jgi:hypothetical protein